MKRIWLDDGEAGIEINGTAYRFDENRQTFLSVDLALDDTGTGITLRHRHTTGFPIDTAAAEKNL